MDQTLKNDWRAACFSVKREGVNCYDNVYAWGLAFGGIR